MSFANKNIYIKVFPRIKTRLRLKLWESYSYRKNILKIYKPFFARNRNDFLANSIYV